MKPVFFETQAALRKWLMKNHKTADELWVGMYKKHTGKPSITWLQVVDEVLCFGWIDGIRKGIDADSFTNRITPRRKGSHWSAVNLKRVLELQAEGRMTPAGMKAYEERDPAKSQQYSNEQRGMAWPPVLEARFKKSKQAWAHFNAQPPGYRKTITWWVISAKREETQMKRLARVIEVSAAGGRVDLGSPFGGGKP
ncbi:MAG: YdeI/OmpD-associated family protein [Anaerolineales bacterium]|nr:MAG: YdeI/OmpD-associated family protein [Anaerolineales bacterium]